MLTVDHMTTQMCKALPFSDKSTEKDAQLCSTEVFIVF